METFYFYLHTQMFLFLCLSQSCTLPPCVLSRRQMKVAWSEALYTALVAVHNSAQQYSLQHSEMSSSEMDESRLKRSDLACDVVWLLVVGVVGDSLVIYCRDQVLSQIPSRPGGQPKLLVARSNRYVGMDSFETKPCTGIYSLTIILKLRYQLVFIHQLMQEVSL